ncbi:MAG: bifunctional phosphoglucose/phosphomannose isomerase [Bacteroidia bacterium]|nr:bifunctional phosphoglucose/phosphomannose isomerase [Bacteroidia bacterium]
MKNYVASFPDQLEEALKISESIKLPFEKKNIQNILITGLGGSGISGTIISELVADTCPVPVTVNKDYSLPAFVNEKSLVIICSYSGNTEETLSVLAAAIKQKAQLICISSGGTVSEIATKNNFALITIPGGHPPRASFAYPLVQLMKIFELLGFSKGGFKTETENFIALAKKDKNEIVDSSLAFAKKLQNKIPVIYCISGNEGVAIRFRQQINENSKMLCWHHVLPEMNHNELVGWVDKNDNIAVVALRTTFDFARSVKRLEICKTIIEPLANSFSEIHAKGNSKTEQTLYLVHFTDWISCHLADLKKVDAIEVNVINRLKSELAKF